MTKFKAVLGLITLFVGGFIVLGFTMWLGYNTWVYMCIDWIIK